MNELSAMIYTAVAAAATLLLLVLAAGMLRVRRRRGRDEALRERYLHALLLLLGGEGEPARFPFSGRSLNRGILAETIAGLVAVTYELEHEPLRRIVFGTGLDRWLLRRIRFAQGYRRARLLALLARLPADGRMAAAVERYTRSRNRQVRFYALVVQLAADPATALRRMGAYPDPFSTAEVAEIVALLRRGMLPIAYEPLLTSPLGNLRRVGLGIVRQFGIEEAEELLLRLVDDDSAPELGREALYALCAMHRPLSRREVGRHIARMDETRRRSLLRRLAFEGYAPRMLQSLFGSSDRPYYEVFVQSYKRILA